MPKSDLLIPFNVCVVCSRDCKTSKRKPCPDCPENETGNPHNTKNPWKY